MRVFQLKDPSAAYEFYTFLLAPGMRNMGVGKDSALSQYDARILVGNFVVQATLSAKTKPESLDELAGTLKAKADPTPLPPLKSYLPAEWRTFGSEKYALGPEGFRSAMRSLGEGAYADLVKDVGFGVSDAEAILARYQGQHGSGVLLLLQYPTPQVAENHPGPSGAGAAGVCETRGRDGGAEGVDAVVGVCGDIGDARAGDPGRRELRDGGDVERAASVGNRSAIGADVVQDIFVYELVPGGSDGDGNRVRGIPDIDQALVAGEGI